MSIIDRCRDPYGPLSDSRRDLLQRLLDAPDPYLWERARGLIVRAVPVVTLERAVYAVSKHYRRRRRAPDTFTLYRALRYAVGHDSSGPGRERGGICR